LLLAGILAFASGAAVARSQPVIFEPEQSGEVVVLEEVAFEGDRVSGVIVNRHPHPVRNVRLVIGHLYRWPNEFQPGEESPNRAETLVVKEQIPAGGRTRFSTTFQRPMPPGPGGDFVTKVHIVGFTEVFPPQPRSVASPEPTP
jgi:hypothetical protein